MSVLFSLIVIIVVAAILVVAAFAFIKLLQLIFPDAIGEGSGRVSGWLEWFRNSIVPKFVIVGVLSIVMLVPFDMLRGVVSERHGHYRSVLQDISETWGGPQQIYGPMLVIPFVETYTTLEVMRRKSVRLMRRTSIL
jgi:hypothetical protein